MQVHVLRVVGSGKRLEYVDLPGACVSPPYGASPGLALPHCLVSAEIWLESQGILGQEPIEGSGMDLNCQGFFGCLEISVGD